MPLGYPFSNHLGGATAFSRFQSPGSCSWNFTTKDRSKEMAVYKKIHSDRWVEAILHSFPSQKI